MFGPELLEAKVETLLEFLWEQENLEAMILNDGSSWFEGMPEEIYDQMLEVQRLRNEAKEFCKK